eukprot:2413856-Rhodomonas_salina.1
MLAWEFCAEGEGDCDCGDSDSGDHDCEVQCWSNGCGVGVMLCRKASVRLGLCAVWMLISCCQFTPGLIVWSSL